MAADSGGVDRRARPVRTAVAALLAAAGIATLTLPTTAQQEPREPTVGVRIVAQRLADGRTEFALQHDPEAHTGEPFNWGERLLPARRFFPTTATVGRWLASSPLTVSPAGGVEVTVRIVARLQADDRIEFAVQQQLSGGTWDEPRLPARRFFPATAAVGRWLMSSPVVWDPTARPAPVDEPDPPPAPPEPPPPEPGAGAIRTLEFSGCGQVYLCATLEVPLDHDDPGGATVELNVGMLPAGEPAWRIGYLLVNPGGPGAGMHDFLTAGAGLSARLLERFDVVGWDPRGVGGSVPSGCWAEARDLYLLDPAPDSSDEQAARDAAARTVAEVCAANLGDAVGHIGTIDTVRDMDVIRRALGAETVSYFGFSYGTLLGLLYADMFGEHLRAAVLDGVADPALSGVEPAVQQMIGFTRTIDDMFAWCRTDPSCPVTGDPADTYYRLLEQVDENPLTDASGRIFLEPARTLLAAVVASYGAYVWPYFFQVLAEATDGDGRRLGALGELYTDLADLGAFISIGCTDGGAATRAELDALADELAEVAGEFARVAVLSSLPCEYWPVATGTRPGGAVAAPDAPPILVVGNRGDNATPYEWAVSVADQLDSGVLVSYDGNEHLSYGQSACVDRTVDDYLMNLVVPTGDVDCPRES